MNIKKLLDLTNVYSESGSVTGLSDMPNLYPEESVDQESTDEPFLPGFAIEIPPEMREDAETFNNDLRDDDAPPDGNARLIDIFPDNQQFLEYLLDHGGELIDDGYEVEYPETAETLEFSPSGPWAGYKARNVAFFLEEGDARGYEEALRRYQEEGREGRAA
jgi:hypothetical protein